MLGNLYYGVVTALDDPDQKGKIQVRILPELQDASEDTLPWLRPFSQASNTTEEQEFDPPEVGSPVWVSFWDEYFQQGFWLGGPPAEDNFDFSKITKGLAPLNLETQTVEQTKFRRYADGTIFFWNDTTHEYGTMHSTGSWSIIRKDGSIEFSGKDQKASLILLPSGEITYDSSVGHRFTGKDLQFQGDFLVSYSKLKAILENMVTVMGQTTVTDPLSGMAGPVMPAFLMSALFPTTTMDLSAIKTETP